MKNGIIKIGGLKYAKKLSDEAENTIFDDLNEYMSPEMLKNGEGVTKTTDIW